MSQVRIAEIGFLIMFISFLLFASCSNKNTGYVLDPSTGGHYGNWIIDHRTSYLEGIYNCAECHGKDLKGGIAGVSCFSLSFKGVACHPNGPPVTHPGGWRKPENHGASAMSAPNTASGFSYCKKCHGSDFSGGTVNKSCFPCHGVNAPHPKNWGGHQNTNTANAPVCFECHGNGVGVSPGCFNGTLCHSGKDD